MADSAPKNAGVHFPPPFLFLLGLGAAWLLETRVTRIRLIGGTASRSPLEIAGSAILAAGLLLTFWGLITFARARTAILPMRPASRIVTHGPYRLTRNPMYTGLSVAYLGGSLLMNSGWAVLLLPVVMLAVYHFVIKREERYLSAAFPSEYNSYRQKVRRWL
ncbi:MAG TPA: isoprenylcysteine carboxylmethyltransferase family protein [Gemmatimonadaceae bacterium]